MQQVFKLLIFICVTVGVRGHDSSAFTFELPDNEKECFFEDFRSAKRMTFQYEVIKGGQTDVDVLITSPNGKDVYKKIKSKKDAFHFESSYGEYSFCFSNEFSTFSHKTIYFELRPEAHGALADTAGQKKPYSNTEMEETLDYMFRNSRAVQVIQTAHRLLEAKGRYVAETLNTRVQTWSVCEAIVVVCMGYGQVMILKRFFVRSLQYRPKSEEVRGIGSGEHALRA